MLFFFFFAVQFFSFVHTHKFFAVFANALVCRTQNSSARNKLFKPVRAPACHTRDGKKRSVKLVGNVKHTVDKSRVKIDVRADDFFIALKLSKRFGREAFRPFRKARIFRRNRFCLQDIPPVHAEFRFGGRTWCKPRGPFRTQDPTCRLSCA